MSEQMESLRERYEQLELRKKREAEGYQTDIKMLQEKMKKVENKLVMEAVSKSKGDEITFILCIRHFLPLIFCTLEHDYIRTIKKLERQVEDLKKSLKKSPDWIA